MGERDMTEQQLATDAVDRSGLPIEGEAIALWRYPVGSLRGERLDELDFAESGVIGDRGYAILDTTKGVLVGSSRPGWDALITWSARYLGPVSADAPLPPVEIGFPDGGSLRSDDPDCDRLLSERIGKPIRLVLNDGSVAERVGDCKPRAPLAWPARHGAPTGRLREVGRHAIGPRVRRFR